MAHRLKDLLGFIQNGFTASVRTTWDVDGSTAYTPDGKVDDYFGCHSFYDLSKAILDVVKNGKRLTVSDFYGKTISLALESGTSAFSRFIDCFGTDVTRKR